MCILGAALHRFGDQRDLIIGMRVEMGRILVIFHLERIDEIADKRPLISRIELYDPNVAERRLADLLLEAKGQPDGAELDRLAAAAFRHAGLRQSLRDLQSLAFECIGRDNVDLADAGDPRSDGCKIIDVAAKSDIRQDLAAELGEGVVEHLGVANSSVGVFVQQHGRAGVKELIGVGRDIHALHHLVRHDAKGPGITGLGNPNCRRTCVEKRHFCLLHERHDSEGCVRALFPDHHIGFVLFEQPLGRLRCRQRATTRVLILHLELVAVDASPVDLLQRELDALLVLGAEI